MKLYKYILPAFSALLILGSCNEPKPDLPLPAAERTVIVYMVANNSLASYAVANINAMEQAFSADYQTRLLLYYNDGQGNNTLYDIAHDEDLRTINSRVVKQYSSQSNPCLPQTLSGVIADCRDYSSTKSYSMIFWSHGTGWIPQGMAPPKIVAVENPSDREQLAPQYTFGSTYSFGEQLEIWELAEALPDDVVFDYISFDACYMGCVELAYQLRRNAKYIMASAAEILAEGFPYQSGLKYVLQGDVFGMSKCFYDYYNSKSGVWRSATTAVVDCSKLGAVADEMKKLTALGGVLTANQEFGRNLGRTANYTNLFWDLGDMATSTWGEGAAAFNKALSEAVVWRGSTPMLFEGDYYGEVIVERFSGLTVYIPRLSQSKTMQIYFARYDWAVDTGLYKLAQ